MITRIQKALAKRREDALEGDKGFTLIELLVVVIIIGILAAIAIPVYIGVQNNAKNSAVQSDLTNIKTAVVAYYTNNSTITQAPTLDSNTLSSYGFTSSGSYTTAPAYSTTTPSPTLWCIQATSIVSSTSTFWVSSNKGVSSGSCPALSTAW